MSEVRKRILTVGESSFLSTGYSVYGHEVLKRLHATGKYELFELGCYGSHNDARGAGVPWTFMSNMPGPGQEEEYNRNPINQFGEWKFEQACLDFKPDIVWTYRDVWMDDFVERSPFRRLFHWAYMPTCDASPQDHQWVSV